MNRNLIILFTMFFASFLLHVYPVLQYPIPLGYDSYYHLRIANTILENGDIPSSDQTLGSRPHIYPPLYHITLACISYITGTDLLTVIRFFLPVISALAIFPVFFFVKRFRNEKYALFASFILVINPVIFNNSYDSPQVIDLFLLPIFAYFLLRKGYAISGFILGVMFLFNYFFALFVFFITVLFFIYRFIAEKKIDIGKIYFFLVFFIVIVPWLIHVSSAVTCLDLSTGIVAVISSSYDILFQYALFVLFLTILLLVFIREIRKDEYTIFWIIFVVSSAVAFFLSLITPELRPWDQIFLFSIAYIFALTDTVKLINTQKRKEYTRFVAIVIIIMLLALSNRVFNMSPGISMTNYDAILWADKNLNENVLILANRDLSAAINSLSKKHATMDIFYECMPDHRYWYEMNLILITDNKITAMEMIKKYNITHVMVGNLDKRIYGYNIEKFRELENDNIMVKVYEMTGDNEFTIIYEVR